jgi:hypothetical protein
MSFCNKISFLNYSPILSRRTWRLRPVAAARPTAPTLQCSIAPATPDATEMYVFR